MATLTNAGVFYESGQSQQSFATMTLDAAKTVASLSAKPWSQAAGYEYTVAPYGLATGGTVTPAVSGTNNLVDVSALTAYMAGATGANATTGLLTVAATTDVSCTRGSASNAYIINAITISSAGAIAVVAGSATTAFSTTRGAAGGPPAIPLASTEIAHVRLTSTAAAAIAASEILQVVGLSQERYDSPVWAENPIEGKITFAAALPVIHGTAAATATATKLVYARVATPVFAEISRARDWVPAETSNSVASEQFYDGTVGSFSSSLGQASFTVSLNDGVTDGMLAKKGQNLLFKFSPDKNKAPYQITQGVLGVSRTFGVGSNPSATVTVSASQASVDFAS
jgi:hypothetical protein